ncbi:hypothetical protein LJK88_18865 [Paenibacillus sp. P26]|nr:hypothetical protein LJK88_18865 [Paenibacillus sp. P26]
MVTRSVPMIRPERGDGFLGAFLYYLLELGKPLPDIGEAEPRGGTGLLERGGGAGDGPQRGGSLSGCTGTNRRA